MLTVIAPIANCTVVDVCMVFGTDNASKYHISAAPTVALAAKNTCVIVPHEAMLSGNVIAVELLRDAADAVRQFVLLLTIGIRAYAVEVDGSVAPVPSG